MDDAQLLRYSRHILLDELGVEGQQRLLDSHALILGAGGLGSPVALYLAASGVGRITLIDDDEVDLTNLQRQIAHTTARVGQPKVASARDAMLALNPQVQVHTLQARADEAALLRLVADADVVIDCCDNFATRHAVNRACVHHAVPLVSGAVMASSPPMTPVTPPRLATPACFRPIRRPRKCAAPPWACWPPSWG